MEKIQNKFFDLVIFLTSIFVSFFRSLLSLFGIRKSIKRGSFFSSLDFVFKIWPSNFWKKPTLFKLGIFLPSFIRYLFYNKK